MSLIAEAPGFLQLFSDGTVVRTAHRSAPSSATSKDITIDSSKPITARIFLPSSSSPPPPLLPLILYFHGGGFCIGSTTWLGYHVFLSDLSTAAAAIILSVDYRLAPENKLPAAYHDCYAALQWLSSGSTPDPWLSNADLSRVFLAGDSAGGNIAHHVAVRFAGGGADTPNVTIKGLLPIHPYFGSEARTELERAAGSAAEVAMNDMFWKLSLPEGADRDFYGCNIENVEVEWGRFPAVAVFVAGLDFLRERGIMYADFLKKKGVKNVSLIEAKEERHVFHAWNPQSEAAVLLQNQINTFMQSL